MKDNGTIEDAPGAMPVIGHALPILRDTLGFLRSLPAEQGVAWVRIGGLKGALVCDPELTHQVLVNDRTFDKGGIFYERVREVTGNGVASCPYSEHRRQRRLLQPAFHHARLPLYAQIMSDQVAGAQSSWSEENVLDVFPEMMRLSARTAVASLFGGSLPNETFEELREDVANILAGFTLRTVLPASLARLPLPGNRRYWRSRARLESNATRIIRHRQAAGTGAGTGDLLSVLLGAEDETHGDRFSVQEVVDQMMTVILGATESTAATISWVLHELALNPHVQHRVYAEVRSLAGTVPAVEEVARLDLLGRTVSETLRLHPPGWIFTRVARADTELGKYRIPAGTTIIYSPYLIHHLPTLYTEPEAFDPDRWLTPTPLHASLPFGAGARKCIADSLATTQAAVAVASIVRRWQLGHLPGTVVRTKLHTAICPDGLRLTLSDRVTHPTLE
ncbi:cytochrome P450 [Streptomyces sp. BE20]|uniref:cytochrome P450 n=1 Tax=unclassified Streptomyces TaxID=2593676 RepID=UPI002E7AA7D0|nr:MULTISPECIES: cytochrome P450 [unclassified Streptomyces]MED7948815.1 cytochrome P450 [Streptomyces sp. BE303]MEE1821304.1 cytochrome P450 [Streptomyces sp. BE20]